MNINIDRMKEISEIEKDNKTIERLLQEQHWEELQNHLQSILIKYPVETMMHNISNPIPPSNLQENAINCQQFLNALLAAKTSECITDNH